MSNSENNLFNAVSNDGIVKGTVVILDEEVMNVTYAGPLKTAPDVTGKLVMMSPEDYAVLKASVDKKRH